MDKVTRPCPQTTTFLKRKESRSGSSGQSSAGNCVKVEVDVQGSPSLPNRPCGLCGRKATLNSNSVSNHGAQELRESRGGCPGLPVPNIPYGFCGRKATLNSANTRSQELRESRLRWTSWAPGP